MIRKYVGSGKELLRPEYIENESLVSNISLYVWISEDESIGFNMDDKSILFMQLFLSDFSTIIFPEIEVVNSSEDVKMNINKFHRAVSIHKPCSSLDTELSKVFNFRDQKKKNDLYERYGRDTIPLVKPNMFDWFNRNVFTRDFFSFVNDSNLAFAIWEHSEFGNTFFHFNDSSSIISDIVTEKCLKMGIEIELVYDLKSLYNSPNI